MTTVEMNGMYVLDDDRRPQQVYDLLEWGKWFEKFDRRVAQTTDGKLRISTIFLGLDYQTSGRRPLLFETMVFGGEYDQGMERYSTWEEAETGHRRWCEKLGLEANLLPGV